MKKVITINHYKLHVSFYFIESLHKCQGEYKNNYGQKKQKKA